EPILPALFFLYKPFHWDPSPRPCIIFGFPHHKTLSNILPWLLIPQPQKYSYDSSYKRLKMEFRQFCFVLRNYDRSYNQSRYRRHEFYVNSEWAVQADIPDPPQFASDIQKRNNLQPTAALQKQQSRGIDFV